MQNDAALHAYLKADIPLIICNPLTTSPAEVFRARSYLRNSNTILVFAHTLYGADTVALRERYEKSVEGSAVLFVDPYRASAALDTLKANPGSSLAVQQYQDGFIQSGIASISRAIKDILDSTGKTSPRDVLLSLTNQTSSGQLHSALSVARIQLKEDQHECDQVFLQVSTLRDEVELERYTLHGRGEQNKGTTFDEHISSLAKTQKVVANEMDRLSLWKMITRVDDITSIVSSAVAKSFTGIEKQVCGFVIHVERSDTHVPAHLRCG